MKRHIGIIIFVTLFISIVSVIAIFIARGYNFTKNEIKTNGILSITTDPENAIILINGEEKARSPKKIELPEGTYELEVKRNNYKSWKKEVFIEASYVKEVDIKLFPIALELEQDTFTDINRAFFSNDGSIAIYTVISKHNSGIWMYKLEKGIFDLSDNKPVKIADLSNFPKACFEDIYNIQISNENTQALLECNTDNLKTFYQINLNNPNSITINVNSQIGFDPDKVEYGLTENDLLVTHQNLLFNYNVTDKKTTLLTLNSIDLSYSLYGKRLIVLKDNDNQNSIYFVNPDLSEEKIDIESAVIKKQEIKSISASPNNDTYFLLQTKGGSYLYFTEKKEIQLVKDGEIEIFSWSPNGNHFTYLYKGSLFSCIVRKYPDKDSLVKNYQIIKNYNKEDNFLKWSPTSEYLVINDLSKNKVYSYDIDGENKNLIYEGTTSFKDSFTISKNGTFLILLLQDDNGYSNIYSLKLKI